MGDIIDVCDQSDEDTFGFIVMDHMGALFGTLRSTKWVVLNKFNYCLPERNRRFARLHNEERIVLASKTAELTPHYFIDPANGKKPNITGLVIAAPLDMGNALSDMLVPCFRAKIINILDVICGEEYGFYEAIQLSANIMKKKPIQYLYDDEANSDKDSSD